MPGTFVLSLDTEIAWGTYTPEGLRRHAEAFDHHGKIIDGLLALLEEHQVPATWAIVGALLREAPPGVGRPTYSFAAAPDSQRAPDPQRPHWYSAPDLVDRIRASRVSHEIGTHTFFHTLATDPGVTREHWETDLGLVTEVCPAQSLVHPQNRVAFLDTLPRYGLRTYRGVQPAWYSGFSGALKRLCHLLDRALALTPPTFRITTERVPVNVPASMYLLPFGGPRAFVPGWSRVLQARRGLERAVARDELFHLWLHPFNLGTDGRLLGVLGRILAIARELRVEVRTMNAWSGSPAPA